jgi:hypothetical protein
MSFEEEKLVNERNRKLGIHSLDGPSNPKSKGKGPDPRNWGGAGIPSEDFDIEKQVAALRKAKKRKGVRSQKRSTPMSDEIRGQIEQVTTSNDKGSAHRRKRSHSRGERNLKAYNQISSESYLGKAFKQAKMSVGKKASKQTHFEDPSDSSSSSSERSPNDNSTSDEMTNKSGDNSTSLESISDRESDSDPDSLDSSSTSFSESENYP